ncbi:MAG: hypothetical protein ABL889_00850 [Terricaulis sp.]
MAVFLILAGVIFLAVAVIRRAAPIGLAVCVAWATWQSMSDVTVACAVAIITLGLAAGLFDVAASSPSRSLRTLTIGIELVTASAASAWLAFSVWPDMQNQIILLVIAIGAALFAAGFVLKRRMFSRQCSET